MIIRSFETAIRVRRGLISDPMSGQATLSDWAGADEVLVEDVLFSPGTSAEFPNVDLDALTALAVLYLPYGADIRSDDRVRVRGSMWDVEGRRADWPGELIDGSVITLRWLRDEEAPDG